MDIPKTFPCFPGTSLLEMTRVPLETSRGPISILKGTPYIGAGCITEYYQTNNFMLVPSDDG